MATIGTTQNPQQDSSNKQNIPKTTRCMSLKENHEKRDSSLVQRRDKNVENGSALEENFG